MKNFSQGRSAYDDARTAQHSLQQGLSLRSSWTMTSMKRFELNGSLSSDFYIYNIQSSSWIDRFLSIKTQLLWSKNSIIFCALRSILALLTSCDCVWNLYTFIEVLDEFEYHKLQNFSNKLWITVTIDSSIRGIDKRTDWRINVYLHA